MKITSLTQNNPAFKGEVYVIPKDLKNIHHLYPDIANFVGRKVFSKLPNGQFIAVTGNNKKGNIRIFFKDEFNVKIKPFVNMCNKLLTDEKIDISLKFKDHIS